MVESLDLGSPLASVKGTGSYVVATRTGEAKANLALPSVAPLSAFAEQPLTGSAAIELTARSEAGDLTLGWQGTLSDFGVPGVPPGPGGTHRQPRRFGVVEARRHWSLAGVRVASEGGALHRVGSRPGPAGTLDLALDLPGSACCGPAWTAPSRRTPLASARRPSSS